MGNRAGDVVFRNTSRDSCRLRGWPRIAVRTELANRSPTPMVSDVTSSNLAVIQVATIVLRPGDSAVVTATSAAAPAHCVTRWSLGLTLPGTARAVPVREPGGSFAPCVGGQLRLSPFNAEQTLTNDIKALERARHVVAVRRGHRRGTRHLRRHGPARRGHLRRQRARRVHHPAAGQ